ncbi:hypothetical protein SAMN05444411_1208 [Lutibacter oricola]|uniref:Uncharacterized protein n=1 Tax=Lutibacter oricola TaxID=762486 RepID=A0A1H3GY81_9FLAO|nr:hypothetical protein [Lutibacter oricola]SDY07915.1 hypothetical protein SAMN05444411_1208 [Lutibacter oricola]
MKYYLGAYYLIKLKKIDFGKIKGSFIHTCSTCINDSYFDAWSISWAEDGKNVSNETKSNFNLNEKLIIEVQNWSDQKFEENKIGWICAFADLKTLKKYKESFFPNENQARILSINFPESEKNEFLKLLNPENSSFGEIGISKNLKNGFQENNKEQTLGYDLIGVENSGEFHSFHCHDLSNDLKERFKIKINEYGLLDECNNWKEIVDYMNDKSNGFESVPWFYVKVKQLND